MPLDYLPLTPDSGTGLDGANRGATLRYRYGRDESLWDEPGFDELTDVPLWPWPQEERIKAAFSEPNDPPANAYPTTNDTRRGFCADGQGLYGGPITLTSYIWEYLGSPCPSDVCAGAGGQGGGAGAGAGAGGLGPGGASASGGAAAVADGSSDGGCGCRQAREPSTRGLVLGLWLAGLVLLRRRSPSRRASSPDHRWADGREPSAGRRDEDVVPPRDHRSGAVAGAPVVARLEEVS